MASARQLVQYIASTARASASQSLQQTQPWSRSLKAVAVPTGANATLDAAAASTTALPALKDLYKLAKGKLTLIVMTTAAAGFAAGSGDVLDYGKLAWTCAGTYACSAAANTLNQIYEVRNDGAMRRTMLRPLPAGRMSVAQAAVFAGLSAGAGALMLSTQVNSLTAALGVGNIALYAAIYTPLKQVHPINTWVGAVVGAVPPLMGWAAATGGLDPGAGFLAAVLYFWQLPHFMALAWMCKEDYTRGGHRMLSRLDVTGRRTAGIALRNALALVPLGFFAIHAGIVEPAFLYESVGLSLALALPASAFYSRPSQQTARLLFRMSLLHLPLYLIFWVLHRTPNNGALTWDSLREWLQRTVEEAETVFLRSVHGGHDLSALREPAPAPNALADGLTSSHKSEQSGAAEAMIFPFSPPVRVPCPYTAMADVLAPSRDLRMPLQQQQQQQQQQDIQKDNDQTASRLQTSCSTVPD